MIKVSRREAVIGTGMTLALASQASASAQPSPPAGAQWIAYPGQLAAHVHARRMKAALERCVNVGYPGNFHQPLAEAYFRRVGRAEIDTQLRWLGPVGRISVTTGKAGGDITRTRAVLKQGAENIAVHVDFAETLPCLLLEGGAFSTGAGWQASLDGETWVDAEVIEGPADKLPDAERTVIEMLPVAATVRPAGPGRTGYTIAAGQDLVIDFRETEIGALRFDAQGAGVLQFQVGESVAEVTDPDPRWFEQLPINDIELPADRRSFSLPERAFRFVRIASSGGADVTRLRFDAKKWPVTQRATFRSSDPELNAIWDVAVATLHSNLHDFYLDGIRRDGLIWHDGTLSLEAYERVFFDQHSARQTLISQTLPQEPQTKDLGILDTPMYDVIGFEREFMARGDATFPKMFADRITSSLDFLGSLQDERGFVDARNVQPYGYFPDWSRTNATGPDPKGAPTYAQMLLKGAFSAGARLAAAWGDAAAAERYAAKADALKAAIRRDLREPATGLYINGFDAVGMRDARYTSFAQAFAVAFDIAEPDEYAQLFGFLNDTTLRTQFYSLSQVVEMAAYGKAGRTTDVVATLKRAWLPLITGGYRRFFEDIDATRSVEEHLPKYSRRFGNSLCHAWAGAAPVMALSRGIVGVEPLKPGYATCLVEPRRTGLADLSATVPTPHGMIDVEWSGSRASVRLPRGVTAVNGNNRHVGPGTFPIVLT